MPDNDLMTGYEVVTKHAENLYWAGFALTFLTMGDHQPSEELTQLVVARKAVTGLLRAIGYTGPVTREE